MSPTFSRKEALVPLPKDAKELSREEVERVAEIIGDGSAAADALRRADEHGGPVRFWYSSSTGTLSVQLLQDMRH
jgi:hypothetical protein